MRSVKYSGQKAFISFSFSTVDDIVGSIFEPGALPPSTWLKALQTVASAGFHNNDYMPSYYTQAFHKRALALCNQYEISNRIV